MCGWLSIAKQTIKILWSRPKLNDTAVEYINGIEVIKVLAKKKFSTISLYVAGEGVPRIEWMRKFNLEMGIVTAFLPSGLFFLLPAGC